LIIESYIPTLKIQTPRSNSFLVSGGKRGSGEKIQQEQNQKQSKAEE
jgi:hypothetical protein